MNDNPSKKINKVGSKRKIIRREQCCENLVKDKWSTESSITEFRKNGE